MDWYLVNIIKERSPFYHTIKYGIVKKERDGKLTRLCLSYGTNEHTTMENGLGFTLYFTCVDIVEGLVLKRCKFSRRTKS